jgi:hypothetical protein
MYVRDHKIPKCRLWDTLYFWCLRYSLKAWLAPALDLAAELAWASGGG